MKKSEQIADVIEEILNDGKEHSVKEFKEKCKNEGINLGANENAVSNVLFKMKKEGKICAGIEKGYYVKEKPDEEEIESTENENEKQGKIDWNKYFVLMPQNLRCNEKKITITEKGEIRLNSALHKEIQSKTIEFIFSNDCKEVILKLDGKNPHKITKAGTTKNREIVEKLKNIGIKFPVSYGMKWDEEIAMWRGKVDVSSVV